MKFLLFSKTLFTISDPIALIECFCFQSDFYSNYDLKNDKTIEYVNKIGARIKKEPLRKCKSIIDRERDLNIFKHSLDSFLNLKESIRKTYIEKLCEKIIKKLVKIDGIGFSKSTKILHTLYPDLIPMIDNPLQELYKEKINSQWTEEEASSILIDYYENLGLENNWQNINEIYEKISENNIPKLTKVRIFDILWWSYIKARKLGEQENINWSIIKF